MSTTKTNETAQPVKKDKDMGGSCCGGGCHGDKGE